jgi:hypothetical protein
MNIKVIITTCILLYLNSCIVQSPKYTTFEQVMRLQLGMTKTEVEKELGIEPYDIKVITDTTDVYIYVYRVNDRRTLYLNTRPANGKKVRGRYLQLSTTFSKAGKLLKIESCNNSDDLVTVNKINIDKIILFITVTLPVILVYLGLKN